MTTTQQRPSVTPLPDQPNARQMSNPSPDFSASIRHEVDAMEALLKKEVLGVRPKYPESMFRHYFAGYFLGLNPVPENQNLHAAWASQVGSIHIEVEVVSDTDPNHVLFIVPPLVSTDGLDLAEAARRIPTRYNEINNRHEEAARNSPVMGRQQFERNIAEKLQLTFSLNRSLKDHYAKWASVFNYYNVPIPHANQNNGEPGSATPSNAPFDLFDIVPGI